MTNTLATATAGDQLKMAMVENFADFLTWVKATAQDSGKLLKEGAKAGAAFAQEQVPLFVKEVLMWEFWSNAMTFALVTGGFLLALWLCIRYIKKTDWESEFDPKAITCIFSGFASVILFCAVLIEGVPSLFRAVKVAVAPRVVLVEKAAELVKQYQGK